MLIGSAGGCQAESCALSVAVLIARCQVHFSWMGHAMEYGSTHVLPSCEVLLAMAFTAQVCCQRVRGATPYPRACNRAVLHGKTRIVLDVALDVL